MALLEAQPALATTTVFQPGNVKCTPLKVDTSTTTSSPPKPLLIYTPTVAGLYPVILFCHGFYLRNYFYSDLLRHISSHGFIVVAPQFYEWIPMSGSCEVKCAGKVADWIAEELQPLLPENVEANLNQLVLAGHSRGGKTAFAVALWHAKTKLKFSVLIGIDPVAGASKCKMCRTSPYILTYVPRSFDLKIPVAVIGTGLGPEKKANCCSLPCAPDGVNHKEFFNECRPPCAYFVATDYGHMDMLNDDPEGIVGELSSCMCKNGTGPRELMRRTVGGLVVAFLRARLNAESQDLDAIVADPSLAPAKLDPVEYVMT